MKYTKNWYVVCNDITRTTLQDFFKREKAWGELDKKSYSDGAAYGWRNGEYKAWWSTSEFEDCGGKKIISVSTWPSFKDWEEISFEEFLSTIYAPTPMYEIY